MHIRLPWYITLVPVAFLTIASLFIFRPKQPLMPTIEQAWVTKLHTYDMTAVIHKLGYDPEITVYPGTSTHNNDQITVYVHGWGDSQKSISYFRRNSDMLPGTMVGFNFKDANYGGFLPPYKTSNFCQKGDIAPLALTLKVLDDCGLETIHLFGHSRGGGTITTTLARLHHYHAYKKFFRTLGISKEQAQRIVDKVRAGTIVLNCPLVDIHTVVREKLNYLKLGFLAPLVRRTVLPTITNYRANGDSPLNSAKIIQNLNLNILVHFQKDDLIVGNATDAHFYKKIMGPSTYLVLGNDGGHTHRSNILGAAIHAFHKKHGGAYNNDSKLLYEGQRILDDAQPATDTVEEYIAYFCAAPAPAITDYCPSRTQAWHKNLHRYDMSSVMQRLGYNPNIKVYPTDTAVQGESTTIYVHGYGSNQSAVVPFLQLNTYTLPGTIIGFDFQDVIPGSFMVDLQKSNVGQEGDIATLASILKILDDCGLNAMHLAGTSRGGATTVNTLARLCEYDKYTQFFTKLDISKKQATTILNKISSVVLNCSLVDSRAAADSMFGKLGAWIVNTVIPAITQHNPNSDQAIDGARIIRDRNFPILIHFEHNDKVVGNTRDADFYKNIYGPHTYLVLADEGGHMHEAKTLGYAVQAFMQKYGGAYYPNTKILKKGKQLLANGQPSLKDIDRYVSTTYARFAVGKTT